MSWSDRRDALLWIIGLPACVLCACFAPSYWREFRERRYPPHLSNLERLSQEWEQRHG